MHWVKIVDKDGRGRFLNLAVIPHIEFRTAPVSGARLAAVELGSGVEDSIIGDGAFQLEAHLDTLILSQKPRLLVPPKRSLEEMLGGDRVG
jgi:hypothetical protein